ncbi:hypothetical protein QE152_g11377 [Popillia japonica]|uniref:Uncharacterized protein n=1 Tax=Popillia japonica TaxID=7064 RepID=A0AAW1LRN1_POPJA
MAPSQAFNVKTHSFQRKIIGNNQSEDNDYVPQESSEDLRRWVINDNLVYNFTEEEVICEVTYNVEDDTIEETRSDEAMLAANTLRRCAGARNVNLTPTTFLC